MRKILLFTHCLCVTLVGISQGKNALDLFRGNRLVANQFYENMDYRSALHFYEKVLEKNPKDTRAQFQVAKCHLQLNNPQAAEVSLAGIASEPKADLESIRLYAEVLRRNGRVDEAKEWYRRILEVQDSPEITSKLHFLDNIDYYSRASTYEVSNLDINSDQSDFSLQPYFGGSIFLSARQTERFVQHQPASATNEDEGMLRFFIEKGGESAHFVYGEGLKTFYHDGPLSFYQDQKKVAFTRNNLKDVTKTKGVSRVNLKVFLADCSDSLSWKNIAPFPHNSDKYSIGHPAMSEDGKTMYFSSDMPGGMGGPDLYVSYFDSGQWSSPKNLGPSVNTSGDELFPSLFNDTTLYFASTGLGGFGGLDIFQSRVDNGQPSTAKNVGAPINSEADDFSLYMNGNGRQGFFSSNRSGGKGLDDIYRFQTIMSTTVGKVISKQEEVTLANVGVSVSSIEGELIASTKTDRSGIFKLELPYDQDFYLTAMKDGYSDLYRVPYSTKTSRINYDTLSLALWKNELFVKGRLFSNETQKLINGVTVTLKNLTDGQIDSLQTSSDGTYAFPLAPNANYEIIAKMEGFLANGFEIDTENLFRGDLLNDILLEEEYVDKMIVYFDFDAARISRTDGTEMKHLIRTLKRFPESILNVAAHADSRGAIDYNKKLSQDRLNAIISYFKRNGIKASRIQGIAFGEELLLNQCSDGVQCEEEDHSKNRRAELKVQLNALH